MPISDKDIYTSANVLIKKHGEGALLEAMDRVARYQSIGNESGMRLWNRIANAIEFLQMPEDLTSETLQ